MALPSSASAQHTLTLTGGTGLSTARFYPAEVTKWKWGSETFGLSWRFYSDKPRFVGAVGIDLEYIERGYQVGYTYTSKWVGEGDNKREERTYQFYDRDVSTIMLPLVWQPHVYAARNRLRIFIEAAVVLSFNISSRYDYLDGKYEGGKAYRVVQALPCSSDRWRWASRRGIASDTPTSSKIEISTTLTLRMAEKTPSTTRHYVHPWTTSTLCSPWAGASTNEASTSGSWCAQRGRSVLMTSTSRHRREQARVVVHSLEANSAADNSDL